MNSGSTGLIMAAAIVCGFLVLGLGVIGCAALALGMNWLVSDAIPAIGEWLKQPVSLQDIFIISGLLIFVVLFTRKRGRQW